jgi:hypothetical protein
MDICKGKYIFQRGRVLTESRPRNGKAVTHANFIDGLNTVFNVDKKFIAKLTDTAFAGIFSNPGTQPKTMNLEDLAKANVIVHNASLTRPDMGRGYTHNVVPAMVEALLADSPNDWIYPKSILATRTRREEESKRLRRDTSIGTGLSESAHSLAYGEAALLLLAMNGTGQNFPRNDPNMRQWPVVPKKAVRTWLLEERIPDGFLKAPQIITEEFTGLLARMIREWRKQDIDKQVQKATPRTAVVKGNNRPKRFRIKGS